MSASGHDYGSLQRFAQQQQQQQQQQQKFPAAVGARLHSQLDDIMQSRQGLLASKPQRNMM